MFSKLELPFLSISNTLQSRSPGHLHAIPHGSGLKSPGASVTNSICQGCFFVMIQRGM